MSYENIIEGMVWSYSRIKSFSNCKYAWSLKYLYEEPKESQFFSDFGKFVHDIYARMLKGEMDEREAKNYYLINFFDNIRGSPPNEKIYKSYFEAGLASLQKPLFPERKVLGVEKPITFSIGKYPTVGFIDLISEEDGLLIITDHKSHNLSPHGKSRNKELDEFFRQLYIYSIPMENLFGRPPDLLEFNCFRTGKLIKEPFNKSVFENVKRETENEIEAIIHNEDFSPNIDFWYCNYLCDVKNSCEYYKATGGKV